MFSVSIPIKMYPVVYNDGNKYSVWTKKQSSCDLTKFFCRKIRFSQAPLQKSTEKILKGPFNYNYEFLYLKNYEHNIFPFNPACALWSKFHLTAQIGVQTFSTTSHLT